VVVRASRAALAALRAHAAHPPTVLAALRVLWQPCSNAIGAEPACARAALDEGGAAVLAGCLRTAAAARQWPTAMTGGQLLALWLRDPREREAAGGVPGLYDAVCACCVACRDASVPDGLRMVLGDVLNAFGMHPANAARAQAALLLMEEGEEEEEAAAAAAAAAADEENEGWREVGRQG
jgi:hypothetical protein